MKLSVSSQTKSSATRDYFDLASFILIFPIYSDFPRLFDFLGCYKSIWSDKVAGW